MREFLQDKKFLFRVTIGAIVLWGLIFVVHKMNTDPAKPVTLRPASSELPFKQYKMIESENKDRVKKFNLTPSNPADYGMVLYDEETKPQTQEDWDNFIEQGYTQIKRSLPEETKAAMASRAVTKEQYEERMQEVADRINFFEDKLKENPDDEAIAARLERLKMLNALGKVMKEDMIAE